MSIKRPVPDLETLRGWRVRGSAGTPAAGDFERVERIVTRTGARLGEFIDAWEDLLPARLRNETRVSNYRAGTVHVTVSSSGPLYEIDRLLREGLEADLRRRVKGTLAKVRLTVGPLHDPAISGGNVIVHRAG